MANISTWTNVKVFMSDALGAAVAVTGVSKAAEAVVLCANPPANGAWVLMEVQGMTQINLRAFRVSGVVAGVSFKLEGEDSQLYDTFVSGTFKPITFATTMSTLTTVNGSGGEPEKINSTTIHAAQKSNIQGLADALSYSFDTIWDVSDAALKEAKKATVTGALRAFMIQFKNGQRVVFYGTVFYSGQPGGQTGGMVTGKMSMEAQGAQTEYAN